LDSSGDRHAIYAASRFLIKPSAWLDPVHNAMSQSDFGIIEFDDASFIAVSSHVCGTVAMNEACWRTLAFEVRSCQAESRVDGEAVHFCAACSPPCLCSDGFNHDRPFFVKPKA